MIPRQKGKKREKLIRIEREGDDEGVELIVRHVVARERKTDSTWSWNEEFVAQWSETLIRRKR